jgi:hypothetical protein
MLRHALKPNSEAALFMCTDGFISDKRMIVAVSIKPCKK